MGVDIYAKLIVGLKPDEELTKKIVSKLDQDWKDYYKDSPEDFWRELGGEDITIDGKRFTVDYDYENKQVCYFGIQVNRGGWWDDEEVKLEKIAEAMKDFVEVTGLPPQIYVCPRMSY